MGNEFYFSIIIPFYNSREHINKCLESLISQTYKNFEVVFIDDCSTDATCDYIKESLDGMNVNYRLYHNRDNIGPGESRFKGVELSSGDYISFLDSDDWIENSYFATLNNKLGKCDYDIVFFNFNRCFNNKKVFINSNKNLCENDNIKSILAYSYDSICVGVYRREILLNIDFPKMYNAEDAALVPVLVANSSNIGINEAALYNYNYRLNSLSTSSSSKVVNSLLIASKFLINNIDKKYKHELEFRVIMLICYAMVYKAIEAKLTISEIKKNIGSNIVISNDWFKNQYLSKIAFRKKIFLFLVFNNIFFVLKFYVFLQVSYFRLHDSIHKSDF